jgi:hypothetical protein
MKSTGMLAITVLAAGSIGTQFADAATINAASCSQTVVQAALNSAHAGDTVSIPSGTCTWTTSVSWTAPPNVILMGAGNQSIKGGGDVTTIVDNIDRSAGDVAVLDINTNASGTFRMTGITFTSTQTGNNVTYNGSVRLGGSSHQFRMDHVHLLNISFVAMTMNGWIYGVIDHMLVDMSAINALGIRVHQPGWNGETLGVGDQSWADATTLGSERSTFVEDSIFSRGYAIDCSAGGRYVFRYNTLNDSSVETHPTGGGGRVRGCRSWEIYGNSWNSNGAYRNHALFVSSGTGVIWGNTIPSSSANGGSGYTNFVTGHVMRNNNSTYPQTAPPNGWGYCGTGQTGATSPWDKNTDSSGYPCIDQLGRGQGNLVASDFPNAKNALTGTIAWPNQALEPIYEWLDNWSPVPNSPGGLWDQYDPQAKPDRDYYLSTPSFNGTSGVGSGALSSRPATCTMNVAFWATDTNTLYQCSATNTWTTYYKPYAYPHPLTGGASGDSSPPTVSISVQ